MLFKAVVTMIIIEFALYVQNYQVWQQQHEGLTPVIGDGLLGGNNLCQSLITITILVILHLL